MTNIIILIGDLGGGKTTLAAWFSLWIRQDFPNIPQVTNVTIDSAYKVQDTNKFLAMKLITEDKDYAFCIEDEAAQAGLESRGSGSKAAALESRVITLARKAHVDLILVSQLMSMIEKRAQWLGTFYILCEAVWEADNPTPFPDYFDYTVFANKLEEIGGFEIYWHEAMDNIFHHMDTDDIPYAEKLKKDFIQYFEITQEDLKEFDRIMENRIVV